MSDWSFLDNISTASTGNDTADDVRANVDAANDMGTSITGAAGLDTNGSGNSNSSSGSGNSSSSGSGSSSSSTSNGN